jgi:hypothetical protein
MKRLIPLLDQEARALMLCVAHTERVPPPPWTSLKIPIICSSLNRLFFIGPALSKGAELHFSTVLFQEARPTPPVTDVRPVGKLFHHAAPK